MKRNALMVTAALMMAVAGPASAQAGCQNFGLFVANQTDRRNH